MDAVQQANIGHPGMPMGAAPMAYALWSKVLRHNPSDPHWANRDRFVLSAGHGSMLLYALLYLTGYDLTLDDIKAFRQWGSRTPGHPEWGHTPGVETTTGPLGQGFANGVGMALVAKHLAARFNRPGFPIVDHKVYAIVSDGDLMEGISHEAASLAGHLQLDNLIYLYDDNEITIDGPTELSFSEDVLKRFNAYGWHAQRVEDGNDLDAVSAALARAQGADRPTLISIRTVIGYGSPNKQGTADAHGSPLGPDEVALAKRALGWPSQEPFFVPDEALTHARQARTVGVKRQADWEALLARYAEAHPKLAAEWAVRSEPPALDWAAVLPRYVPDDKPLATRQASGQALAALAPHLPQLIGGSADLTGSNNTAIKGEPAYSAKRPEARYLHFGVREHAMGGILNGMALYGRVIPYGGTFLVFADYMRPAIRLAALMGLKVIYVFTHDSVGVGEDGPTHQPIEHLMSLRAIPNLTVLRPADAAETAAAWQVALTHDGPSALCLTRQALPHLQRDGVEALEGAARGAYVLAGADETPDVVLIATGSEVQWAVAARTALADERVVARVISMPSWELFSAQPQAYRNAVLPPEVPRVAIEAGVTLGWERFVGERGTAIGIERFGASAPGALVMDKLGINAEAVVRAARALWPTTKEAAA